MISQSERACPGGSTALRTRCTRRSVLEKVPPFSAKHVAGRTTWANSAVSVRKMSWTTKSSSFRRAFSRWCRSGSDSSTFSPMQYRALSLPSSAARDISTTVRPGLAGSVTPQAFSNLARASSAPTFW